MSRVRCMLLALSLATCFTSASYAQSYNEKVKFLCDLQTKTVMASSNDFSDQELATSRPVDSSARKF